MSPKEVLEKKPSKRFKNENCPFSMVLKQKRSTDEHFATVLDLEWTHNHAIDSLQVNSFRDISDSTKECINDLFEIGYTPSLAYREFISVMKAETTNDFDFHIKMSNRSVMPRRSDFNLLFKTYNEVKYGTRDLCSICQHLKGTLYVLTSSHSR